jgi:DNA-binding GntR family transcriptional regulator
VRDHERLFDAIEQRDPRAPDRVIEHLRLSARLIGEELDRAEMQDGSDGPV